MRSTPQGVHRAARPVPSSLSYVCCTPCAPRAARGAPRAMRRTPCPDHSTPKAARPCAEPFRLQKTTSFFKRISSQPDQAGNKFLLMFYPVFHTGWAARTPRGAARAASRVRRMPRAVHGACAVLCTLHTCAVCCAPHAARRASLAPCHAPRATRRALGAAHRARCVPHD